MIKLNKNTIMQIKELEQRIGYDREFMKIIISLCKIFSVSKITLTTDNL